MEKAFRVRSIAPCLFAVFVDILGFSLALPILTALFTTGDFLSDHISDYMRFTYLAIGLTLYPFFMFFGSSFMGDLSDKIGRRKVLMLCMSGFFLGFFIMGSSIEMGSLLLFYLGRSITGLCAASLPTTMAAIADLSTPQNKAKHMSYVVAVQSIGFVLGPLMAALLSNPKLSDYFDDAFPFFAAGILALIAFIWILKAFEESFQVASNKKIHPLRLILVFVEAAKHPRIRLLTGAFLLHQLGIGFFIQLILIYMHEAFGYAAFGMGLFNAFLGIWMGLGVIFIPLLSKHFKIERVVCFFLALLGISELLISFSHIQWLIYFLAIPVALSASIAWSAILTSFSHAVDEKSQGWALGITGAVAAFAFMITGFSSNLVPIFSTTPIIAFGGVLLFFSSGIMLMYCRKYSH